MFRDIVHQLNWVTLSQLGRSKFIRSFSIWLIIVPILAKFFDKLPREISVVINNTRFSLFLELPFNVSIFYFCSLCFGLASIIYTLKCPNIIKDYKNSGDFISNGGNQYQLIEFSNKLDTQKKGEYIKKLETTEISNIQLANIYSMLVKDYRLYNAYFRITLGILYLFGFILLLLVFIQNTVIVLRG